MTPEPHWTAYLSALLAPVVAVLGSFIAYRQWRLAQNKLKLDLFDRRFKVYDAARDLLAAITTSRKAKDDELFRFVLGTREAKWLLGAAIAEYLDKQLYHKAIDLQTLAEELEDVPVGEVQAKNAQARAEIRKWFAAQYDVLDAQFAPFLQLRH
jgi:hypothetical protein